MATIHAVKAEGVHKSYRGSDGGSAIFRDFSIEVGAGETLALLGPSGCGKTTLLRMIAGVDSPDGGSVAVFGDMPAKCTRNGTVSLMSSESALLPWRSAQANVRLAADMLGTSRSVGDMKAAQWLDWVELGKPWWHHRPDELSEGQRQRVRLAQALITEPKLLLLDEPFSNVDEGLRGVLIRKVVDYLRSDPTRSAILVTHHAYEAVTMAKRLFVLVARPNKPAELYHDSRLSGEPGDRDDSRLERDEAALRSQMIMLQRELASG